MYYLLYFYNLLLKQLVKHNQQAIVIAITATDGSKNIFNTNDKQNTTKLMVLANDGMKWWR